MPRYSLSLIESAPASSSAGSPLPPTALSPSTLSQRLHELPLVTSPTTASARLAQLSPILTVPPFDAIGRRRCSSPGAFLHMIREDETLRWDVDEGVGDVSRRASERKTSLGLDDIASPVQPVCQLAWSRKTSATSGYSDTMAGGDGSWTESRKTSLADDDRLGTSPDRAPRVVSPTMSHSYEDDIDDRRLMVPGPPAVGPRASLSVPTFHLVIDDADITSPSQPHSDASDEVSS